MKTNSIGHLLASLRKENGWTQKEMAGMLNVSDRTISKWERNAGLPDISLLPEIAALLHVDMAQLLHGDLQINESVGGNMKNTKFYACPSCQNLLLATAASDITCCGRKLDALEAKKADDVHNVTITEADGEWHITSSHPMTKEHHISFIAVVAGDQIQWIKQYPEWAVSARIPKKKHVRLLWLDTKDGLFYQLIR